jgi:hypothetical protein
VEESQDSGHDILMHTRVQSLKEHYFFLIFIAHPRSSIPLSVSPPLSIILSIPICFSCSHSSPPLLPLSFTLKQLRQVSFQTWHYAVSKTSLRVCRYQDVAYVAFEVFTAVVKKSIIFWDMMPCSLLSFKLATCLLAGLLNLFFRP